MTDLEKQVLGSVKEGIAAGLKEALGGYQSPLKDLMQSIVNSHQDEIRELADGALKDALADVSLRDELRAAINHKLGRMLIDKATGEIEKRLNDLRANPETRARITTAIADALDRLEQEAAAQPTPDLAPGEGIARGADRVDGAY